MSGSSDTDRMYNMTERIATLTEKVDRLTAEVSVLVVELKKLRDERNKVAGIMVAIVTGLGLIGGVLGGKIASALGWLHNVGMK